MPEIKRTKFQIVGIKKDNNTSTNAQSWCISKRIWCVKLKGK